MGTCSGDSGAGLLFLNDKVFPNYYMLRGILHGKLGKCGGTEYPHLFANVASPKIWNFIKDFAMTRHEEVKPAPFNWTNFTIICGCLGGVFLLILACVVLWLIFKETRAPTRDTGMACEMVNFNAKRRASDASSRSSSRSNRSVMTHQF